MKQLFFLVLICTSISYGQTLSEIETPPEKLVDSTIVLTINSTINGLYSSISGEKDVPRKWNQFKYLFLEHAKLIPAGKDKKGDWKTRFLSPEDYIKSSEKWLVSNGFIDKGNISKG